MCVCSLSYPACKAHVPYCIVTCGLFDSCHFLLRFLINGTIFLEKVVEHKIFVSFLCTTLSETFFILRRIQWDVYTYSGEVTIIFVRLSKLPQIWNFATILSVEAELFHADGRSDRQTKNMTKLLAILRKHNKTEKIKRKPITSDTLD